MTSIPRITRHGPTSFVTDHGQKEFYFSYETCIAVRNDKAVPQYFRRDRNYSVTTAKHMRRLGVADWQKVPDEEFERLAAL